MGYHRAGFEVVGVDIKPQPHYPFEFHQADALTFPLDGFDAYHASPPCQYYTRLRHLPWLRDRVYWRSVPPTLTYLKQVEPKPWVIENVEDCFDLLDSIILCGRAFGLPIFRHRRFQSNILLFAPPHQKHSGQILKGRMLGKRYAAGQIGVVEISGNGMAGHWAGIERGRKAMGIDWMTQTELSQAIPPAYTEYIGKYLFKAIRGI